MPTFALRWLGLLALAVWLGGFTFYSAVVVPLLHEAFDKLQVGMVTQQATDILNLIGLAALGLGWLEAVLGGRRPWHAARLSLLAVDSLILAALIGLHLRMDQRLESGALSGFYPLHRVYLWLSTAQWFVNVMLLAVVAVALSPPSVRSKGGENGE